MTNKQYITGANILLVFIYSVQFLSARIEHP